MTQAITPAPVRKTLVVRAPTEVAFRVFTERLDSWWPRSHHIGEAALRQAVLAPRPGGRFYEIGEDGRECDWGEVLAWEPPARLVLVWRISSLWRYEAEAYSEVEVRFTELSPCETRVDLEHRKLEGLGDGGAVARAVDGGWGQILGLFRAAAEA